MAVRKSASAVSDDMARFGDYLEPEGGRIGLYSV